MSASTENLTFQSLNLSVEIIRALEAIGYETPSPIQAETIPHLLQGKDVLGQAQTGTGKTAAFALPILSNIELNLTVPQALVLAPTRELALQVSEAFQSYARNLKNFHVLPIYGGQGYDVQLRQLKRGVHVVVGTPGRVMDHIRRGTLKLDALKTLVLDEADEMLRMGFIDDVEWVLQHTPPTRQIALFSATMPTEIRRVARTHLNSPIEIKIASKTTTAASIRQRFWQVSGLHKLDALTRILELEEFDGILIFVRTKTSTLELAEKLAARGFSAAALNGDIAQNQREKLVDRLKKGDIDILVATDVAARGLDVERISHVINYDIPYDTEAYVHRIGRTGRAGRSGQAILFVAPRERRMLASIEKATSQKIEPMQLPSVSAINESRILRFRQRIDEVLANGDLDFYLRLLTDYQHSEEVEPIRIAAALAAMLQGDQPLLLNENEKVVREPRESSSKRQEETPYEERPRRPVREKNLVGSAPLPLKEFPDVVMHRYRLDVGHSCGVKPGNIVGAIANEADLESCYIGHIEIYDDFSVVDLPDGMPKEILHALRKARVCGRELGIRTYQAEKEGTALPSKADSRREPFVKKERKERPVGFETPKKSGYRLDREKPSKSREISHKKPRFEKK